MSSQMFPCQIVTLKSYHNSSWDPSKKKKSGALDSCPLSLLDKTALAFNLAPKPLVRNDDLQ